MARKRSHRFFANARKRMEERGTVGSYGSHSMKQIDRDIAKGGKIGKKAQFAKLAKRVAARRKRRHNRS